MKLATLLALAGLAFQGTAVSGTLPVQAPTPRILAQSQSETPPVSRMQRLRDADAELRAANAALAAADTQLALGKEPLPGERTGNANGTSRLNDAYWARQAENEAAVKEAKARRDAAVAARNAARF
jgi:hypothetical protein